MITLYETEAISRLERTQAVLSPKEKYNFLNLGFLNQLLTIEAVFMQWLMNTPNLQKLTQVTFNSHGFPELPSLRVDIRNALDQYDSISRQRATGMLPLVQQIINADSVGIQAEGERFASQIASEEVFTHVVADLSKERREFLRSYAANKMDKPPVYTVTERPGLLFVTSDKNAFQDENPIYTRRGSLYSGIKIISPPLASLKYYDDPEGVNQRIHLFTFRSDMNTERDKAMDLTSIQLIKPDDVFLQQFVETRDRNGYSNEQREMLIHGGNYSTRSGTRVRMAPYSQEESNISIDKVPTIASSLSDSFLAAFMSLDYSTITSEELVRFVHTASVLSQLSEEMQQSMKNVSEGNTVASEAMRRDSKRWSEIIKWAFDQLASDNHRRDLQTSLAQELDPSRKSLQEVAGQAKSLLKSASASGTLELQNPPKGIARFWPFNRTNNGGSS